jgi:hypothetical protein
VGSGIAYGRAKHWQLKDLIAKSDVVASVEVKDVVNENNVLYCDLSVEKIFKTVYSGHKQLNVTMPYISSHRRPKPVTFEVGGRYLVFLIGKDEEVPGSHFLLLSTTSGAVHLQGDKTVIRYIIDGHPPKRVSFDEIELLKRVKELTVEAPTTPADALPDKIEKHIQSLLDPNCNLSDQQLDSILADLQPYKRTMHAARSAIEPLMHTPAQYKIIIALLKPGLESQHSNVRTRAALTLHRLGDSSGLDILIANTKAADPDERLAALELLQTIRGEKTAAAIIDAIDDPSPAVRAAAIEAAAKLRLQDAFESIAARLNDTDAVPDSNGKIIVAHSACMAMPTFDRQQAIKELIEVIDNNAVTSQVCDALSKITGRKFGHDPDEWKTWWMVENIDGKDIVVCVYDDWQRDPAAHKKLTAKIKDRSPQIDPNDISKDVVIAILAADQNDIAVKKAIGTYIYADLYQDFNFKLSRYDTFKLKVRRHVILDAVGQPLPEHVLQVFLSASKGPKIQLRNMLDETGTLELPNPTSRFSNYSVTVSHPDYGITSAKLWQGRDRLVIPLVPKDSPAADRAIWGYVLDPQGDPISAASIECMDVRGLDETLLRSIDGWSFSVITDDDGYFSLYMPMENKILIPPKAQYRIRIEAPADYGLFPYEGKIPNGQQTTITMGDEGYFRTFAFEDTNGPITDQAILRNTYVRIERKGIDPLTLRYNNFINAQAFPLGTYTATMHDSRGKAYTFEPIEVTEDSPEQLIFRFADIPVVYSGLVIDGVTNQPMPGAFVMLMTGSGQGNFCSITDQQWQALHELEPYPAIDDQALTPLRRIYSFSSFSKTDKTGHYEIQKMTNEGKPYALVLFEQEYISFMYRKYALKPDENNRVEVPTIKLFPAAKVSIELHADQEHLSIWPRWLIDKDDNPSWAEALLAIEAKPETSLKYDEWLKPNKVNTFYVPAGLNLRVKLDTPYDRQFCPITIDQMIYLQHGETLDLGSYTFQRALKVTVLVVDSAGEPVEGVPVRQMYQSNSWDVPYTSDPNGIVQFNVPANSKGKFGVMRHFYKEQTREERDLSQTISYEIAGPEDQGRQFVLQLSDEMLELLFKD